MYIYTWELRLLLDWVHFDLIRPVTFLLNSQSITPRHCYELQMGMHTCAVE